MTNIIVLFPKAEDAGNVRSLLVRHGFLVSAVCTTFLPSHFQMLLVASQRVLSECSDPDLMCIAMPLKVRDLLNTLDLMAEQTARRKKRLRQKPKARSEEEKKIVLEAKSLLMERNHMSEEEAHRYIQKCSMDSGTNLVETAQMVLSLMNF